MIIVLYDPEKDKCYWNIVNKETAILSEQNWKIEISFSNLLENSKSSLIKIADRLTEYEKKFNTFLFAKPWMKQIIYGNRIVLNVEEWINKASGIGKFTIILNNKSVIWENGVMIPFISFL